MECLIQYLDDLEDLFYAVALLAEKIRRVVQLILIAGLSVLIPAGGVVLALTAPPLALAAVCMALAVMLYRAATGQSGRHVVG
jgi:hypothetical protein